MSAIDRMADGYEPDFDIDVEVGRQGELWIARISDALKDHSAEVKTDEKALSTGRVYLEYECRYRGEWKPTGIATTPSDIWCHVIGEVAVVAPTEAVRAVARHYWRLGARYQRELTRGTHPTKGIVIPLTEFVAALVQGVPDDATLLANQLAITGGG